MEEFFTSNILFSMFVPSHTSLSTCSELTLVFECQCSKMLDCRRDATVSLTADQTKFQALLSKFSSSVTDAKKSFYIDKIHSTTDTRKLFSTFKTLT